MKRSEWKFTYPSMQLHDAAKAKYEFHKGRLDYWLNKQAEAKQQIQKDGIEIDESVAAQDWAQTVISNSYRGPSVNIRNDLVKDLTETIQKVSEHRTRVREYDAWMQVMSSQQGNSYDLHQDDWMFFFGK